AVHKTALLEVESIRVELDFKSLYKGDINIKSLVLRNGGMSMFVRGDGYSNLSVFRASEPVNKGESMSGEGLGLINKFSNVRFVNFAVNYIDSISGKRYGAVLIDARNDFIVKDPVIRVNFSGKVYFNGLVFNKDKGAFLTKQQTRLDLLLAYDRNHKALTIYPSVLENSSHDKIEISGVFDLAGALNAFELTFKSKKIAVDHALPLLPQRVREQINSLGIDAQVDTQVHIQKQRSAKKPRVNVVFKLHPFQYNFPLLSLRKVVGEGIYTNQGDSLKAPGPENARLIARDLHGLLEAVPFKVKFVVSNFTDPVGNLDGTIMADSTNLNPLLDPSKYRVEHGKAKIDFHFEGNLKKIYDPKRGQFNAKLTATAKAENISVDYLPRHIRLKKINGTFSFNEKALIFPNLSFNDGQNMVFLQGTIKDLIPYILGSSKSLRTNVNINIPIWKLTWLETLLAPRPGVLAKRKKKLTLSDLLDDSIDKMEITAQLNAGQMKYKRLTSADVKGRFIISNNAMQVEYFQMTAFNGASIRVRGEITNSGLNRMPHLAIKGSVINADVRTLFSSFNNFGQTTITDQNLNGLLNTDFNFDTNLSNNVQIVPASMSGSLHIYLTNGNINNFGPFLKMKRLVFKNRNLGSVRFAPIKADFRLNGLEIEIERMEIESNVFTLFADGVYSFGRKTDINIEIPLSNLKRRDSTYVLDPNNPENGNGSKIFLKAIDEKGEVNIKLALRKRDRKKGG
ncbi:MAG: AsmA-like C-terminal region-containing protein, partial [Dyadobacter sp.]